MEKKTKYNRVFVLVMYLALGLSYGFLKFTTSIPNELNALEHILGKQNILVSVVTVFILGLLGVYALVQMIPADGLHVRQHLMDDLAPGFILATLFHLISMFVLNPYVQLVGLVGVFLSLMLALYQIQHVMLRFKETILFMIPFGLYTGLSIVLLSNAITALFRLTLLGSVICVFVLSVLVALVFANVFVSVGYLMVSGFGIVTFGPHALTYDPVLTWVLVAGLVVIFLLWWYVSYRHYTYRQQHGLYYN